MSGGGARKCVRYDTFIETVSTYIYEELPTMYTSTHTSTLCCRRASGKHRFSIRFVLHYEKLGYPLFHPAGSPEG